MTTMLLLLLSAILIGTGVSLIWRDLHGRRRDAFVSPRDPKAEAGSEPEVEVTISRPAMPAPPSEPAPAEAPAPRRTLSGQLLALAAGGLSAVNPAAVNPAAIDPAAKDEALPRPDAARPSATAQQWAGLQPMISAAVEEVNAVLAGAGVAIGTPGEPSWGASKAYGSDRRILVGGQSLAWLRLECTAGGRLFALVKAHEDGPAEIDSDASAPASGLSVGRVSDLLSECLKLTASHAVHTKTDAEQRASEAAWKAVEPVIIAALKAGNGALSQAGAKFVPLATPAWDAGLRHHRMPVAVLVLGTDIARMHIDRLDQELEVAVGVPDAHLASLGRRERIALEGMTMHALAELIAGCAWPAIARYHDMRQHT
ncbi:MAG: hypothetical protein K2X43_08310 [Hyphomonadaceae bacterium]|nr:hypothetical protein [Hyphomonadaceae bacterium]